MALQDWMKEWAMEAQDDRPLAVIVKGNPKYLSNVKIKPMADAFYAEVKALVEEQGYRVEFDPGRPQTLPNTKAQVWIGHSRGIDRLQYAPEGIRTIALQTNDHVREFASNDEKGMDSSHYQLSRQDVREIRKLKVQ